ncbi:MAG: hypothetical protein IJV00_00735 [Clostridia bacterium]|nr:hypothetical protein [Clostridia bacterium]
MTEEKKNELKKIYVGFSDEQIAELYAGEKEGVDFSSYADASLSAEEMKAKREALGAEKKKNVAAFECRYFSSDLKELCGFYNPSELLMKYLFSEEIDGVSYKDIDRWAGADGVLQGKLNRIMSHLENSRKILDGSDTPESVLPEKYAAIAANFKTQSDQCCLWFYPGVSGKADVYKSFGKNGQSKIKGITLDESSAFALRDVMPGYSQCYYSIGFTLSDYSFSVTVRPNNTATKAAARAQVVFCDSENIFVDDLSKYTDTEPLTSGLRS